MPMGRLLFFAALAGLVVSAAGVVWLAIRHMPGMTPLDLFLIAHPAVKLTVLMNLLILALTAAVIFTRHGTLLLILGLLSAALGVIGGLIGWHAMRVGLYNVDPIPFAVTAPSHAEALAALALGFLGAAIALGARRPAPVPTSR